MKIQRYIWQALILLSVSLPTFSAQQSPSPRFKHKKAICGAIVVAVLAVTGTYAFIQRKTISKWILDNYFQDTENNRVADAQPLTDTTEDISTPNDAVAVNSECSLETLTPEEIQHFTNEYTAKLKSVKKGKGEGKRREQAKYKFLMNAIIEAEVKKVIFLLKYSPEKFSVNTFSPNGMRFLGHALNGYLLAQNDERRNKYEAISLLLKEHGADIKYVCYNDTEETINDHFVAHKEKFSSPLQNLFVASK